LNGNTVVDDLFGADVSIVVPLSPNCGLDVPLLSPYRGGYQ
jgi:hypothetical protein